MWGSIVCFFIGLKTERTYPHQVFTTTKLSRGDNLGKKLNDVHLGLSKHPDRNAGVHEVYKYLGVRLVYLDGKLVGHVRSGKDLVNNKKGLLIAKYGWWKTKFFLY
jgi:hypothetical protein